VGAAVVVEDDRHRRTAGGLAGSVSSR